MNVAFSVRSNAAMQTSSQIMFAKTRNLEGHLEAYIQFSEKVGGGENGIELEK